MAQVAVLSDHRHRFVKECFLAIALRLWWFPPLADPQIHIERPRGRAAAVLVGLVLMSASWEPEGRCEELVSALTEADLSRGSLNPSPETDPSPA